MTSKRITATLEQLAEVLQTQRTLGAALANIAEVATRSVPRCDAASVGLSISGRPATAAASARIALELDMVQYDVNDGPCLTAFRSIQTMRLDVVELDEAFPHLAVAAREHGITSILSVPALWGDEPVATLNLYSRSGAFDETASSIALVLASQVAIAVSRSPEFNAARDVVEEAQREVDDQTDVGVATGLLMGTQACSADQALGLLREAAAEDETTIVEIAHQIIQQHHNLR